MRTSRYSTSRQKACQQCSSAKARCDRDRKTGPCGRCRHRGLPCVYPRTTPGSPVRQNFVVGEGRLHSPFSLSDASFPSSEGELLVADTSESASATVNDHLIVSHSHSPQRAVREIQTATQCIPDLMPDSKPHHFERHSYDRHGRQHVNRACSDEGLIKTPCAIPPRPPYPDGGELPAMSDELETLEFSDLELVCPVNPDEISNRWLNAYMPIPGQTVKEYPAGIAAFIFRVLKSYAGVAVHGRGILPFIHPKQLIAQPTGSPLSTCLSLVRICANPLPGREHTTATVLQREMSSLYESQDRYNDEFLFAAFQAYLIYTMVLFFRLNQSRSDFFRRAMTNLQELACSSSRRGLTCAADRQRVRPRWEEWIVAEAKRRTLYVMYLLDSVLSSHEGFPTFLGTELQGLPAPANTLLWQARRRYDWEREYNMHMAQWMEGFLTVDELWPMPADLVESQVVRRRARVDRWLENLDEFGTMLYAVMSCTHGG
ncbi:hypothetical protein BDV36DRAFT_297875 [Aspergillus pseudocaelatus]|uniref:Zn(2)-C6 fungal-type domain-containing protein n=1 Tax=Aspergillus pseudocaelatus TaxID=1825620 RepID=A0ABQ6WEU4_9EURO|nr:hypothetical protein BDV36DRAFT_297875 [Aspergillus pseudocaelatus]